jgi:RsmE family RNA methyltransferase
MHTDLQSAISFLEGEGVHIALDNYEASGALPHVIGERASSAVLAFGPERGWSPCERDTFRKNGWKLAHLGAQVLHLETACTAAVAATSACLGYYESQTQTVL